MMILPSITILTIMAYIHETITCIFICTYVMMQLHIYTYAKLQVQELKQMPASCYVSGKIYVASCIPSFYIQ